MTLYWVCFFVGLFIGGTVGFVTAALLTVHAAQDDPTLFNIYPKQ